jgi:hypothetical protein
LKSLTLAKYDNIKHCVVDGKLYSSFANSYALGPCMFD